MLKALNFILDPLFLKIKKVGSHYEVYEIDVNGKITVTKDICKTLHEARVTVKRYLNRHELVKRPTSVIDHYPCYQRADGVWISDYGQPIK